MEHARSRLVRVDIYWKMDNVFLSRARQAQHKLARWVHMLSEHKHVIYTEPVLAPVKLHHVVQVIIYKMANALQIFVHQIQTNHAAQIMDQVK